MTPEQWEALYEDDVIGLKLNKIREGLYELIKKHTGILEVIIAHDEG